MLEAVLFQPFFIPIHFPIISSFTKKKKIQFSVTGSYRSKSQREISKCTAKLFYGIFFILFIVDVYVFS